jgi:hypothetical protein
MSDKIHEGAEVLIVSSDHKIRKELADKSAAPQNAPAPLLQCCSGFVGSLQPFHFYRSL